MNEPYLEITFRHGRPQAADLYLPREGKEKSARSEQIAPGLLVDFTAGGQPMGLEITAPGKVSATRINNSLANLGLSPLPDTDLSPLKAA